MGDKTYYTLRYQYKDSRHKPGERVAASVNLLRIGEQEDCDVKFENKGCYVDELFAVIKPVSDSDEWELIPCSNYVHTIVNGLQIEVIHRLKDGDRIGFSDRGQELLFNTQYGQTADLTKQGNIYLKAPISKPFLWICFLVPTFLISLLALYIYDINKEIRQSEQLLCSESIKENVLQIKVDSVYYCHIVQNDTIIVDRYSYLGTESNMMCGTAFITKEKMLITARHCIEPWLNYDDIIKDPYSKSHPVPVLWAMEAETYNQTHHSDTIHKIVSVCEFYRGQWATEEFGRNILSTEFTYRDNTDDILDLSSFHEERYWRSIARGDQRIDMELNDIAFSTIFSDYDSIDSDIIIADSIQVEKLVRQGEEIHFLGYPNYNEKGYMSISGQISLPFQQGHLIAHDGLLVNGFSGGPALVIDDGEVYAIGVISIIDKQRNGNRMYSVPITETAGGGL